MQRSLVSSDHAAGVDAATVAAISVAICVASSHLTFMSVFVPAALVARFVVRRRVVQEAFVLEVLFFSICTGVGAFNDFNSVVRHQIYSYSVPHFFPELTSIPLWMLLFWGMILRFIATVASWRRMHPSGFRDEVHLGRRVVNSGWLKVALLLTIVFVTRQLIYVHYEHAWFSWLPFAGGLMLYAVIFRPDQNERRLALLCSVAGPLVEVAYINFGGLHQYRLGWFAGVPLWIALWWILAALIWKELSARARYLLQSIHPRATHEALAG